jgi:hypothetical protein
MSEESPLKRFADLPGSIDAFIDGLIGFVYRIVLTFTTVWFSLRWGALRARASPARFAKPATALFVSVALVSISSFLGPQDIPKLLAQDRHEILAWMIDVLFIYFTFDVAIIVCGLISSRRRRLQNRTISVLRYAVSGTVAGWFAVAMASLSVTRYVAAGTSRSAHVIASVLSPFTLRILGGLTFLPLLSGILVVGWSASKRWWKSLTGVLAIGFVLCGCALLVNDHSLRILYAVVRIGVPNDTEAGLSPALMPLESYRPELRVGPLICRLYDSGQMQIMGAVSNLSEEPVALDTGSLEIWIEKSKSDILHPDFLKLTIAPARERVLVLEPRQGEVVNFGASVPHVELLNLKKTCTMEYAGGRKGAASLQSDVGSIERVGSRRPN